jgi:two-component system, NtrC family, response regulator HydG
MEERQPDILIVDDEESLLYTFQAFLAREGYSVTTASTFAGAVKLLEHGAFNLVFADIILGEQSGIDLLRKARSLNPLCPVILVTGAPDLATASEAVRLGAYDYIPKPVNRDTLLRVARIALQQNRIAIAGEAYRQRLEAIFHSVKDAIISVDEHLQIVEVNSAAKILCHLDRQAIGHDFESLCQDSCLHALRQAVTSKKTVSFGRIACCRGGGDRRIFSGTACPLIGELGGQAGAVLVLHDETRPELLEGDSSRRKHFHRLIGQSDRMQQVYRLVEVLADVDTTVLITGESGTGKELVAEALHQGGCRRESPLIKVNCSALAENLLESELFGHVRGAFTHAVSDKIGRFQMAAGGTIFLDEIGDISPAMQVKLLRVLQEKEFERVGDGRPIKVDVRVVTATNHDLADLVQKGRFRQDLFFRLKVMHLHMPPLRDRHGDMLLLADFFLKRFNEKFGRDVFAFSSEVLEIFQNYAWPGNVRELEHAIEHAFILCQGKTLEAEHLPPDLLVLAKPYKTGSDARITEQMMQQALREAGMNKAKAARALGISRRTLYRRLAELEEPE